MDEYLHRRFTPKNEEEAYRLYLAASEADNYISKLSPEDRQLFDGPRRERKMKEYFDTHNRENLSPEDCVFKLFRIRANQYKRQYLRDGASLTWQQRRDIRESLKDELAHAHLSMPGLIADFINGRIEAGEYLRARNRNNGITRRTFLGAGLAGATAGIVAVASLTHSGKNEPQPEPELEASTDLSETSATSIDNTEDLENIKSNPKLLSDYGFSDAVCGNLQTYMDMGGNDEKMAEYISYRIISEKMIMAAVQASNGYFDYPSYSPKFEFYEPKITNNSLEGEISVTHHGHNNIETTDYFEFNSSSNETENAVNTLQALSSGFPNEALDHALSFAIQPFEMHFNGKSFKVVENRDHSRKFKDANEIDR